MCISHVSVAPLDMFRLSMWKCLDLMFQSNSKLDNNTEVITTKGLEEISRDLTYNLVDIQEQFNKMSAAHLVESTTSEVSGKFTEDRNFFQKTMRDGDNLLRKIEGLKQAFILDSLHRKVITIDSSLSEETDPLSLINPEQAPSGTISDVSLDACCRPRAFSMELPEEPLAAIALASNRLTPLLSAAGTLGDVPPFLLAGGIAPKAFQAPVRNDKQVATVDVSSLAAGKRKRVGRQRTDTRGQDLVNVNEAPQILAALLSLLKDIPEYVRPLDAEEEKKFSMAFGSDEYIRFTELLGLGYLDAYPSEVGLINCKISMGLKGIGSLVPAPVKKRATPKKK